MTSSERIAADPAAIDAAIAVLSWGELPPSKRESDEHVDALKKMRARKERAATVNNEHHGKAR